MKQIAAHRRLPPLRWQSSRLRAVTFLLAFALLLPLPAAAQEKSSANNDQADALPLVVFEVYAAHGAYSGDTDIYAQRLGEKRWQRWDNGLRNQRIAAVMARDRNPASVSDGVGGAIIVFERELIAGEHKGDVDVVAQRIDRQGNLLWGGGHDPIAVASARNKERAVAVVSDGKGGAIVVMESYVRSGKHAGDIDIIAQRIDSTGELMWEEGLHSVTVEGTEVVERKPVAISDGHGGAIVLFEQARGRGRARGDFNLSGQRIDGNGKLLWNDGKHASPVASTTHDDVQPLLVADDSGGVFVIFENRMHSGPYAGDTDLLIQRLDDSGKRLWEDGKRSKVVSAGEWIERNAGAVSDGRGGVIVVFEQVARKGTEKGEIDIAAERIDPDGKRLWGDDDAGGILVAATDQADTSPAVASDGRGGVLIFFELRVVRDSRYIGDSDIFGQRVGARGKLLWDKGDTVLPIATTTESERRPAVLADGAGGAYVVFERQVKGGPRAGDVNLRAQRVNRHGRRIWGHDRAGIQLISSRQNDRRAQLVGP